jgi:hypothetical protein
MTEKKNIKKNKGKKVAKITIKCNGILYSIPDSLLVQQTNINGNRIDGTIFKGTKTNGTTHTAIINTKKTCSHFFRVLRSTVTLCQYRCITFNWLLASCFCCTASKLRVRCSICSLGSHKFLSRWLQIRFPDPSCIVPPAPKSVKINNRIKKDVGLMSK